MGFTGHLLVRAPAIVGIALQDRVDSVVSPLSPVR